MTLKWQTEDDSWEEPLPPPAPRGGRVWVRLLAALLLVGLLTTAVWLFYRQAQASIAQAEAIIQADIMTSHNLLIEASAAGDTELLANLLSGRDLAWTDSQLDLLQQNMLFARPQWDLIPAEVQPGMTPTITLNAELDAAVLTTAVAYFNPDSHPNANTADNDLLIYQHQLIYRRGDNRWLLAPPLRDAAQRAPNRYSGTHVLATFPVEDHEMATRIAQELDTTIAELCSGFDMYCPEGEFLQLTFTDDPRALLLMAGLGVTPTRPFIRNIIVLPTPALVGQPLDEAGYHQLFQGYANYLLGPLVEFGLDHAFSMNNCQGQYAASINSSPLAPCP